MNKGVLTKGFALIGILCICYCIGIGYVTKLGSWFFLLWGLLGAVFLLLSYVASRKKEKTKAGALKRGAQILAVLLVCFFFAVEGLILSGFWKKAPPELDYLVVLGAQMLEDGPSKDLKFRLDTACAYLMEHENTIAIVSGGQGSNEPISEAQGMYDYLTVRGIEPNRIRMEDQSVSTAENIQFSQTFMEKQDASVGIVTSNFHVFRGVKLAEAQGYTNVHGLAAPSDWFLLPNNMLREFVVLIKDCLVGNI